MVLPFVRNASFVFMIEKKRLVYENKAFLLSKSLLSKENFLDMI